MVAQRPIIRNSLKGQFSHQGNLNPRLSNTEIKKPCLADRGAYNITLTATDRDQNREALNVT